MIDFNGGLTIAMQSKDRKAAMAWYKETLGWDMLYDVEEIGWCEIRTSVEHVNIGLSDVESPKVGGPVPTFGVSDIDAARKEMEGKGVKFDGETREYPGMVKLATFYDRDGNALMLFQDLSQQ
jgi:predicted enzyme related to lactoylglutathione lyase